jgi:hypothetical protein
MDRWMPVLLALLLAQTSVGVAEADELVTRWVTRGTQGGPRINSTRAQAERGIASRQSFYLIKADFVPVWVIKITECDCDATLRDWEFSDRPDFDAPLSKQCALGVKIIHTNSQDIARMLLT